MKSVYEKPVITKLQSSLMNKFGLSTAGRSRSRPDIDGASIPEMIAKHGSPLFVFSEQAIRRKFRQYHRAFTTRYPNVVIGWSYKTNYLKAICALMHEQGAIAEVVSKMEYQKAKALGVPGNQIIFNGPHKSKDILLQAVQEGATINVDHQDEIEDLESIARKLGRPVKVGIRLNLDSGIQPQWSRFGFNLETGQAMDVIRHMSHEGLLELDGLHCHIGTFILDTAAYGRQVRKMVEFAKEVEKRFGFRVSYLDVGGGFPSRNKLKGSYLSPDVMIPSIDEYAESLCDALLEALPADWRPKLILESGRMLVEEAGYLVTSVLAAKRLADGLRAYVLDAGVNLLYTATWYKFQIETVEEQFGLTEPCVLYGPLCMNIDVVDDYLQLPPLSRGQQLVISPVGAYNNTQWMQFIEYRPAIVMVGEDGQVDVIREAEELSDVEHRERLPERFAHAGSSIKGHASSTKATPHPEKKAKPSRPKKS